MKKNKKERQKLLANLLAKNTSYTNDILIRILNLLSKELNKIL